MRGGRRVSEETGQAEDSEVIEMLHGTSYHFLRTGVITLDVQICQKLRSTRHDVLRRYRQARKSDREICRYVLLTRVANTLWREDMAMSK